MANDFTALAPTLYKAAHEVSRELTGFVAGANVDFDMKQAAEGDTIQVPRVGSSTGKDYTPAMTTTAGDDSTPSTDDLTITKNRMSDWHVTHAQRRSMIASGTWEEFQRQKAMENMRVLVNELELDLATEAYQSSSRATGSAGTTPFASNLDAVADLKKILDDNGAPGGRCLVGNTAAGANIRKRLAAGFLAGADARDLASQGTLLDLHGFAIKESAQLSLHTRGTGTGYLINNGSGEAVGQTVLTLDTGSGTIVAGDIITHASDSENKYVVNADLSGGDVTIGRPGLRIAAADNDAVTVGVNYTPSVAFARTALAAAVRPPTIEPNASMRVMLVADEKTNLTFLVVEVVGDGMTTYRAHLCWGVLAVQPEHIATLLG